jgi:hypothetical protein
MLQATFSAMTSVTIRFHINQKGHACDYDMPSFIFQWMFQGRLFAVHGHKGDQCHFAGEFDGFGEGFLVPQADAGVVAGLDALETIDEETEGLEVLVIDVVSLVGAESTASISDGVLLVG